jgi:hypothetical protein
VADGRACGGRATGARLLPGGAAASGPPAFAAIMVCGLQAQPSIAEIMIEEHAMGRCNSCGNEYEGTFEVMFDGKTYTFDCFECAIHQLAPRCGSCETRILGHGVQFNDRLFCSSHCARAMGIHSLETHIGGYEHPTR